LKAFEVPIPLRGIIPPMITPLRDRDVLDRAGLERLIEHILAGGVHGLFILGTTGEGPSLCYRLRQEVIDETCEQVNGRVPVLVGITDSSFTESVNLAEFAADAGAQAVVLAAPFYYPMSQAELLSYTDQIAAALPLPIFLYNMPSHTKVSFGIETLRRLLDNPNIAGLKDSSGQMVYFHEVLQMAAGRPDFALLVGPEQLLAETLLLGGHGGVSGGANLFPKLYVGLYDAATSGRFEQVKSLHAQVIQIATTIYAVGRDDSRFINGTKCAAACLGLCDDRPAEPLLRFSKEERARIEQHVRDLEGVLQQLETTESTVE
jgi:4-hydroxy-tetrahydrodipicolinate synthase